MGSLHDELELKVESLYIALQEAINLDEVNEYIELNKRLLGLKMNKNDFSMRSYNDLLDKTITKIDALKETDNVKLFLELLDKFRKSKEVIAAIELNGLSRK